MIRTLGLLREGLDPLSGLDQLSSTENWRGQKVPFLSAL
jgi:hypothetical protein